MRKIDRIAESQGTPSLAGQTFVHACEWLARRQCWAMARVANWKIGAEVIRCHEQVFGHGTRPAGWWVIANTKLVRGHAPQSGGWFWAASIGAGRWKVGYGCGWGDPGQWRFGR